MDTHERHPISADFPQMEGDRFDLLVESIRRRGYDSNEPITLFQGKVLDGWNRYRAALQTGVEPDITVFDGSFEEAVNYSLDKNTARRQLTKGQEAYALLRMNRQLPEALRMSDAAILRRCGGSTATLVNARKLLEVAPDVAGSVADGSMSVAEAETSTGVKDHHQREFNTGGLELSGKAQKQFNEARAHHPFRPTRKTCVNQALQVWSEVCKAAADGKAITLRIAPLGKYGKVVVEGLH